LHGTNARVLRRRRSCFALPMTLLLAGCGVASSSDERDERQEPVGETSATYVTWSDGMVRSCTIAKAHEPTINVCLSGRVSAPDLERAKAWSKRGLLTWLRVSKTRDDAVTSRIAFDCNARHITFNLTNGRGTSHATPSRVVIYMSRPYGTWTHELGHAFAGLLDTYTGSAGTCHSGHPPSLMCWGAYGPRANPAVWSTLWPDDIAGVAQNHAMLFGATSAPGWAGSVDLEKPVDADDPWPGADLFQRDQDADMDVIVDPSLPATPIDAADDPRSQDL
jgi:hypothetical protein